MTMDAGPIKGEVKITFQDQVRASWTPRLKWTLFIVLIVLTAINIWQSGPTSFEVVTLIKWIFEISILLGIVLAIWFLIVVISVAIFQFRLAKENLLVTYTLSPDAMVIMDATGTAITIPWIMVSSGREDRRAFRINLKPAGQRYFPKRAFSPADLEQIRTLIREKLGKKARLKD